MASDSSNTWFGVSMALIGVIAGFGVASFGGFSGGSGGAVRAALTNPTTAPAPAAPIAPPAAAAPKAPAAYDPEQDHVLGGDPDSATVYLFEYSDYQCPFCKRNHPTIKQIIETYGDEVAVIYRHFPLSFHPNAQPLAEMSECVAEQAGNEGFQKFTDAVFGSEVGSEPTDLMGKVLPIAKDAGVTNEADFKDCVTTHKYAAKVNAQMADGSSSGVTGTPGHVLMNVETGDTALVSGARPFEGFKPDIDRLLNL